MINFILCDDNETVRKNVLKVINKIMMKNKLDYKTHDFSDYNKDFFKIMQAKLPNKIYILDIETPSASGIDVARKIRRTDIDSILIFLTSHNELGPVLLQEELMFLAFINKFNDQSKRLHSALEKSLLMIGNKKSIRFEDKGAIYTISLDDILYITHDSVERKSIIVTDYTEYKVNRDLNELKTMLDERFQQTHRACITNMNRVDVIDKKNNEIIFDNGMSISLLSEGYKKELSICLE